jgi:hypothetical protein
VFWRGDAYRIRNPRPRARRGYELAEARAEAIPAIAEADPGGKFTGQNAAVMVRANFVKSKSPYLSCAMSVFGRKADLAVTSADFRE